jgi:hypothetical protein
MNLFDFTNVEGKNKLHTGAKLMRSEAQAAGKGAVL